jgi:hypothetical protein
MTNTNKITFDQYLVNCIDTENYGVAADTEKEKLTFLYDTFINEQLHNIKYYRGNKQLAFKEWIMGLPSCFNLEFENYQILNLAYLLEIIPANATEEEEEKILNNWFKYATKEVFNLFKNHQIG